MLTEIASLGSELLAPGALLSYIGPGAGLELVGAMVGLFVTLGTSTAFIVLYPVRKLLRRRRDASQPANSAADEAASAS